MPIAATNIRRGMTILFGGEPCRVIEFHHHTPGNLRAMVHAKLRKLKSDVTVEHRFRASDTVEEARLETHELQFLYRAGDSFHFMNVENYEQVELDGEALGDAAQWMADGMVIIGEFYEGKPVAVDLRRIAAAMKINTDLERMADLAEDIAERAVRLAQLPEIPIPDDPALRAAVQETQFLSPLTRGLTLRYGIFIRSDCRSDRTMVIHELAHTAQYERLGGFEPFLRQYLFECLTIGYPEAPMEQEVIELTARICG